MVSVIIPTYNRAHLIERAISSVLNQTYQDLELIVVDDCSTDNTKQIVEAITDPRLQYVCLAQNAGACAARNEGISLANGEYIAFQDSDDEWYLDKLEKQLAAIQHSGADISFCAIQQVLESGTRRVHPVGLSSHICSQEEVVLNSLASTQTIVGRSSAVKKIQFDAQLTRLQDYDFMMRASKTYSIYYLNEILVNVFMQADSISATITQHEKTERVILRMLENHRDLCAKYPAWEVKQLKILAHAKILLEKDVTQELLRIYKIEHNFQNAAKFILAKLNLLKFIMS